MKESVVRQRLTSPGTPASEVTTKPPSPSRSNASFMSIGFSESIPTKPNSTFQGYIRQRRPSESFRVAERESVSSRVNALKEETAVFHRSFRTTQHAIKRLEDAEWQRVKNLQVSIRRKEEKEHMEYNRGVDLQFKSLLAKQYQLETLLRRNDKEKEIEETREIKQRYKKIAEQEHNDFLNRESLKSQHLNNLKHDKSLVKKIEREENRRTFRENLRIKRETQRIESENERKEIEYVNAAKAAGEWKLARTKSQQSLMELRRLQKLLGK